MNDVTKYILIALGALLIIHQISFRLLFNPAKYKEARTVRAAHAAFQEDSSSRSNALVEYKHVWKWRTLLNLYKLKLHRDAPAKFFELRQLWNVEENEYMKGVMGKWESFGSVGLSGSLFFHSEDGRWLLKSLGRTFENRFLHQHFMPEYFDYVKKNPDTLINKITDVLYSFDHRFGDWIQASPSHYIVIENIAADKTDEWEIFDLKPTGYLEPFRDLLPKTMQMSGVTDILPKEKAVLVSSEERASLLARFRKDLDFLAHVGSIDYSVLLVRLPDATARFALIDCFWSLRELRARVTKVASDAAGLPQQTVTADAEGYASECMRMLERSIQTREILQAQEAVKKDAILVDVGQSSVIEDASSS